MNSANANDDILPGTDVAGQGDKPTPSQMHLFSVIGGGLAGILFVICAAMIRHRTGILAFNSDDSYIYTGYVKMAFTPGGGLFSYNPGEHSAGTTGILFYYVLAGFYRLLAIAIPKSPGLLVFNSWLVSGICFALSGSVVGATIREMCGRLKITNGKFIAFFILLTLAICCTSENYLWGQMGGMENPLSALLTISLAAQAVRGRPNMLLASALAASLMGTRPDWAPVACIIPALGLLIGKRCDAAQPAASAATHSEPGRVGPGALDVRSFHTIGSEPGRVGPGGPEVRSSCTVERACGSTGPTRPGSERLRGKSRVGLDLLRNYFVFAAILALIFVPLRLKTGQWQPSALGARVELHFVRSTAELWRGLNATFANAWGQALGASWLAVIIFHRKFRAQPGIFLIPIFITLFLLMRVIAGLDNFNVHDRYVSYLWPAMSLTYVLTLIALFRRPLSGITLRKATPVFFGASGAFAVALLIYGAWSAIDEIARDTREMLQVHVFPSQWMAANLPADAIVAMEPAGALRTYTDFALVDRTGLTTRHYERFSTATGKPIDADFADLFRSNDVQYVFDYPRQPAYASHPGDYQIMKFWSPKPRIHSLGTIALMRLKNETGN